ncbi:MAG: hypothetical protein B6D61_13570 [Bacteroidetes bacterium 4484_249]|nr:MAG: hypothetical protein B6D61_13570 [Bacteroidetes bacterium 4484_249]
MSPSVRITVASISKAIPEIAGRSKDCDTTGPSPFIFLSSFRQALKTKLSIKNKKVLHLL